MTTPDDHARADSAEVSIEVPGTPEEVWEAIATGPGVSAWFVTTEIEGREGGRVSFDMGSGMEPGGEVTAWEPPRRLECQEDFPSQSGAMGRLATEYLVEARAGGTCVMRIVSTFSGGEGWERELESMGAGWGTYLNNLRLYLTHFAGETASNVLTTGRAEPPLPDAWAALTGALGLAGAVEGERVSTGAGAPAIAGVVDRLSDSAVHHDMTLRIEDPAPGVALVHVYSWGERVHTHLHAYLFGDDGAAVAAREQATWSAWMGERFPAPADAAERAEA